MSIDRIANFSAQREIAELATKTHCKHGHPFDEANTWRESNGHRHCKQCWRDRRRRAA